MEALDGARGQPVLPCLSGRLCYLIPKSISCIIDLKINKLANSPFTMKDMGQVQFVSGPVREKETRGRSFNDREPIWC